MLPSICCSGGFATAHKLALLMYALIQTDQAYDEQIAFPAKPQNRQKQYKQLKILAEKLGIQLPETLIPTIT